MESLGYEKTGKIVLGGFTIFALVVIFFINLYYKDEKAYHKREVDMSMSQSIMLDTKHVDELISNMYEKLYIQKRWLEKNLNQPYSLEDGGLADRMIYIEDQNVSIIDEEEFNQTSMGSLITYGHVNTLNSKVLNEINQLSGLYQVESILHGLLGYEMNSAYYSKNHYVSYYPYTEFGSESTDYPNLFNSIDNLIGNMQDSMNSDDEFDPDKGWENAVYEGTNEKILNFSIILPVIINDEISGVLSGSIREQVFYDILMIPNRKMDYYLLDSNNTVIYSNNKDVEFLGSIDDVFNQSYSDLKYYNNKFPMELEIREEEGYTLYITTLLKEGWHLVYVVEQKNALRSVNIILINILLFTMIIGTLYFALHYSNKKRRHIENMITDSRHDGMTELLNHKYIMETLKRYLKNWRIRSVTVMMLDLDNFKKINDTYGHSTGDDVIKITAQTIKNTITEQMGACGRYGGEEFLVVVRRAGFEESLNLAENIRLKLHENIAQDLGLDVTISIGLYYAIKPISQNSAELVDLADKNLYKAKFSGKNQVISNEFIKTEVNIKD